jgi:hypothetical protein
MADSPSGIAQQVAHSSPALVADRFHQRLLCFLPFRLGVLNKLMAFLCEGDQSSSLVGALVARNQTVSF